MSEIKKITAKHFGTWGEGKILQGYGRTCLFNRNCEWDVQSPLFGNVTFSNQVNERFLSMAESEQIIWIE